MSDGIIVAIGGWGTTVVAAAVAAWAALRARRKLDGDVSIFDVWVCEERTSWQSRKPTYNY